MHAKLLRPGGEVDPRPEVFQRAASGGVCLLSCTESAYCTEHLGVGYNCDTESNLTTGEDVRVCIDSR